MASDARDKDFKWQRYVLVEPQTQEELEYIRTHAEQFNEMTDNEIASGQEWLQSMLQAIAEPLPSWIRPMGDVSAVLPGFLALSAPSTHLRAAAPSPPPAVEVAENETPPSPRPSSDRRISSSHTTDQAQVRPAASARLPLTVRSVQHGRTVIDLTRERPGRPKLQLRRKPAPAPAPSGASGGGASLPHPPTHSPLHREPATVPAPGAGGSSSSRVGLPHPPTYSGSGRRRSDYGPVRRRQLRARFRPPPVLAADMAAAAAAGPFLTSYPTPDRVPRQ